MSNEGTKDDNGKLRYDLIPPYALDELARVYTIGANKYGDRNWEKGLTWGRVFAAMMRHAWSWWRGETHDLIDGQHHLSSVAWCAFALMTYEKTSNGNDDRPFAPQKEHEQRLNDLGFPPPDKDILGGFDVCSGLPFEHCAVCVWQSQCQQSGHCRREPREPYRDDGCKSV